MYEGLSMLSAICLQQFELSVFGVRVTWELGTTIEDSKTDTQTVNFPVYKSKFQTI